MPHTILVVDDEPDIVRMVRASLQTAGYDVATATDGQQALDAVQAEPPDLIVLDIFMPVLDGMEVLRQLKADAATRDIPVVMLTANERDTDVLAGRSTWDALETVAYLTKPFDVQSLLVTVKHVLGD
jgi:CheY-like chemotaxis protein